MAKTQSGAISFGLVHIPVSVHSAAIDDDIRFNQLDKKDFSRIRYKKVSQGTGKEVAASDIIKGYEYEKDRYVVVTDEDFERIKTEKDRDMTIEQFTTLDSIPPVYYDKAYYLLPDKGGDKAFALLREGMIQEKVVGIGKTVLGSKETMLAVMPSDEGLLLQTMHFENEIREFPKGHELPQPSDAELNMARQIIQGMIQPFNPSRFKDEYQERLRGLIEDKIAGNEIPQMQEKKSGNVIKLMDALKATLEMQQEDAPKSRKRKAG